MFYRSLTILNQHSHVSEYLTYSGPPAMAAEVDPGPGDPTQQIYWPKNIDGGRQYKNDEG